MKVIMINIKVFALFLASIFFQSSSHAVTLLPLNLWAKDKSFSTLSVQDTVTVTLRCSIAYDINRLVLEEFSNLKADGLRKKIYTYRWVNSRFAVLLVKDKNKLIQDNFMQSMRTERSDIYEAYFLAMKNNEPVPHSLSTELLATDVGFCNSFDKVVFDAYAQMKNAK